MALSSQSKPHSREWDGRDSGLILSDITAPGQTITFAAGEASASKTVKKEVKPNKPIPDYVQAGLSTTISITESGVIERIKTTVDIQHPFIGDLQVTLTAPNGQSAVLHPRSGGSKDDLVATYDSQSPGVLTSMIGKPIKGIWTLNVADRAKRDTGTLRRWRWS